jgi:delta 1-pyrroline-5-carboxylate dehydrogenase
MLREGRLLHQCSLPSGTEHGTFFAPRAFEIEKKRLQARFGPILHVVRWQADRLDAVLDEIAATGYGLTAGIHSRIDETVRTILARLHVGNVYVNRNMIGAVVGVQPFGGEELSGTGPKAGGPRSHRSALTFSTTPRRRRQRHAAVITGGKRGCGHVNVPGSGPCGAINGDRPQPRAQC